MGWTFFLVDPETYEETDWAPAPYLNVAPRLIEAGDHEGKYAINVEIFNCDPAFEQYRELLETMPTAVCDDRDAWWPPLEELPE